MPRDDAQALETTRAHLTESARIQCRLADEFGEVIARAAGLLADTFLGRNKVLILGNGGSAADSQHMAAELVCRLTPRFERPGLPAVALTTDSSILTAAGNDMGFDSVFERQVQALGSPGDLLVAISTSGRSPNVLRAVRAAREQKMRVLALTGQGGELGARSDIVVPVPSENTQHIQEAHICIAHVLVDLVEQRLFRADEPDTVEESIQA